MLEAACTRHQAEIAIANETDGENSNSDKELMVAALFEDPIYHTVGLDENDGLENTDVHMDFGNDSTYEIQKSCTFALPNQKVQD